MRILTNLAEFPERFDGGEASIAASFGALVRQLRWADLLIVNGNTATLRLAALFLLCPPLRRPLIALDLVLRRPARPGSWRHRLLRLLLGRVDHFLHYFRDLHGYAEFYGIGPERSSYVAFKPNIRHRFEYAAEGEGDYVLCFGRSLRDYDTFLAAVEKLPWPAAMPRANYADLAAHHSRLTRPVSALPANVQLLDNDLSQQAMLRMIRRARLVALPILPTSICASGIGTYLNAMLMGKCVILTEGPGSSDVLTHQALFVPPEDPEALAAAIDTAWQNDELRRKLADAGRRYAESLGGQPELCRRILEAALIWYRHEESQVIAA